jgi:hypothetical protein
VQKAEKKDSQLHVGTGEGIKLGLLVLGFLRQILQFND